MRTHRALIGKTDKMKTTNDWADAYVNGWEKESARADLNLNIKEIEKLIKSKVTEYSDIELSKKEGHVQMIFSDGEIGSQKGGSLLWQRNMHCFAPGVAIEGNTLWSNICTNFEKPHDMAFPETYGKDQTFIFCTEEHAHEIRTLLLIRQKMYIDHEIIKSLGK
jgi:hypothetical protein